MKLLRTLTCLLAGAALLTSCQDDLSDIGSSLVRGEVTIVMDTLTTDLSAKSLYLESIDGRAYSKLLGRINVPEYGRLDCSFVTQMLCANKLNVPDSIAVNDVDSVRLSINIPRGALVGDSLAPQQLTVYRLTKQLPADITSGFDVSGYYDPSQPWGRRSYTASVINKGDSAVKKENYVSIPVKLPTEFGRDLFNRYRAGDTMFEWPASFNAFFPGIYVEQNFGNGCVANVTKTELYAYWHRNERVYEKIAEGEDGAADTYGYVDYLRRDSICLMSSQPIVLSSNNIRYTPSAAMTAMAQSESVITSPGGYVQEFTMPIDLVLDRYLNHDKGLSVVSALTMELPATAIKNDYGIGVVPYLLMVKKKDYLEFFADNKVPDGLNAFYAAYDYESSSYRFNALRDYFLALYRDYSAGKQIDDEDLEFMLVPVSITTETVETYGSSTVYVTRCEPYLVRPTMTHLDASKAQICFTFSNQTLE